MKDNIHIIFNDKANSTLEQILKEFNLEESLEEFIEKTKKNKLSNIVIVTHLIRKFAKGEISKDELINSLKEKLEISLTTAQELASQIINKIIPILIKASEKELEDPDFVNKIWGETTFETNKESISFSPLSNISIPKEQKKVYSFDKEDSNLTSPILEKTPKKIKTSTEKNFPSKKPKTKILDKYREPIE